MTNFYELTTWLIHQMPAKRGEMHKNDGQNGVFIFVLSRNFLAEAGLEDIGEVCMERYACPLILLCVTQAGKSALSTLG